MTIETGVRHGGRAFRRNAKMLVGIAVPLLMALPANASVTATLIATTIDTNLAAPPTITPGVPLDTSYDVGGSGFTFVAESRLTDEIYFKNGLINASLYQSTSVTTGVAVTFYNDHDFIYEPVLHSTLLAAGMGIGMADFRFPGYGDTTSCTYAQLKNCGAFDRNESDMFGIEWNSAALRDTEAGFIFDVSLQGASSSLFHLSSRIAFDNGGNFIADVDGAASVLKNFTAAIDTEFVHAYSWDDTGVDIATGIMLSPGDSITMIFTTTSFARALNASGIMYTASDGNTMGTQPLLYASFGDPTGGKDPGGTKKTIMGLFSLLAADPDLDGINTNSFGTFKLPTEIVDEANGKVTASLVGKTTFVDKSIYPYGPPAAGAVPEPSSWAMLIGGLALVGGLMRRRAGRAVPAGF